MKLEDRVALFFIVLWGCAAIGLTVLLIVVSATESGQ